MFHIAAPLAHTHAHCLASCCLQRKINRDEVDQRMVRALADMPAHLAEEAVVRYARSIDDHVRNRQGFMVSWSTGDFQCQGLCRGRGS
jgi:hypothetical protein